MSGWIKLEKDLLTDPRLLRVAQMFSGGYEMCSTRRGEARREDPCNGSPLPGVAMVLGAISHLWMIADTHIGEDDVLPLGIDEINKLLGFEEFCEFLPADWLQVLDSDHVKLPGYHEHNGTIAKERALAARRAAKHRKKITKENAKPLRNGNGRALPDQDQDQDQDKTKRKTEDIQDMSRRNGTDGAVEAVFKHWQLVHGHERAKLDGKRKKLILARLAEGYSEADLCQAIAGYLHSPHHMGQNDKGTKYTDIELLLRDATHVDRGLKFQQEPPSRLSEKTLAIISNTQDWQPPELRRANA
jgi:hypothetical protein